MESVLRGSVTHVASTFLQLSIVRLEYLKRLSYEERTKCKSILWLGGSLKRDGLGPLSRAARRRARKNLVGRCGHTRRVLATDNHRPRFAFRSLYLGRFQSDLDDR